MGRQVVVEPADDSLDDAAFRRAFAAVLPSPDVRAARRVRSGRLVTAGAVTARLRFLSPEQVLALHEAAILRQAGGLAGSGHRGSSYEGVDAAVQRVKNSYYDTVPELAAACAVYIVQGHVFADGNKRTGAATKLTFLQANGGRTALSDERLATLMIELQRRAESGEDVARLIRWIAEELTARPVGRQARGS